MCGSSAAQNNLANQEASFSQTLQNNYSQTFTKNQEILDTLNSVLGPILTAGPNQPGFGTGELETLNTQAIDSSAQGVQQIEQTAGAEENAAGGGRSFLPSGVNAQINAGIESAAESNLANEKLGIMQASYATGRQNWQNALAGEEAVAAGESPLGYASATNQSNQSAFNEATQINQENQQFTSDLLGGIANVFTGGLANIDTTGSSTAGEQAGNFLTGALGV